MRSTLFFIALLSGTAGCSQAVGPRPASDACALMSEAPDGSARYKTIEQRVPNLETCAARLEAIRMIEGRSVVGIYNGHFIFVTEAAILSAQTRDGTRFRVFEPKDRAIIQDGIKSLVAEEAGA